MNDPLVEAAKEAVDDMSDQEALDYLMDIMQGDEDEEIGLLAEMIVMTIAKRKPNVRNKYLKAIKNRGL